MRVLSSLLLLSLSFAFVSAASEPPAGLDLALASVEKALAEEGASPWAVDRASSRLRRLPASEKAPVYDLLVRLEAQLAPLTSPAIPSQKRQQWAQDALETLDLLSRKTGGDEAASLPPGEPTLAALVPGNDDCANATALAVGSLTANTTEATNDGSASCGASTTAADVWYSYTAAADGLVTFDTFGSEMDTVLSLHSACPDAGGDHELSCNDDARGSLGSLLGRQMVGGETVYVRVSGAGGTTGNFILRMDDREGGIQGQVTKEATGEPAQARIQIYNDQGSYLSGEDTEPDGTYLVTSLPAGDFFLYANSQNLINEVWNDVPCQFTCSMDVMGTPVTVDGDLVEGIDFALTAGGSVTGRVTDSDTGEALPLYAYTDVIAYDPHGVAWDYTSTNYQGIYGLTGLPEGAMTIRVIHLNYRDELWNDIGCEFNCDVTIGDPVIITDGTTVEGIDFALDRMGSISGSTTSAVDGSPLGGFDVSARDSTGSYAVTGYAFDGRYYIAGVPPGDHFVVTQSFEHINEVYDDLPCLPTCPTLSGEPVTTLSRTETAGIDFALDSLGNLNGWVYGLSDVGKADVNAYNEAGSKVASTTPNAFTAHWRLGLLPGTYYLEVEVSDSAYEDQVFSDLGCNPPCDPTLGTPISVAANSITGGFDFHIDRCSADSYLDLANLILDGPHAEEACRTIHAGSNVTVKGTGHLLLTAGRSVSFGDGFRVESGGGLTVIIDPDVASD